jgi:hypothetical protein
MLNLHTGHLLGGLSIENVSRLLRHNDIIIAIKAALDVSRAERLRSLTENREVAVIDEEADSLCTSNFF